MGARRIRRGWRTTRELMGAAGIRGLARVGAGRPSFRWTIATGARIPRLADLSAPRATAKLVHEALHISHHVAHARHVTHQPLTMPLRSSRKAVSLPGTGDFSDKICSWSDNWDLANVALDIMLDFVCCIRRVTTFGCRDATLPCESDILVVSHRVLGQAVENLVLTMTQALYPFLHIIHHLALDLGVTVVEVRVEPEIRSLDEAECKCVRF